MKAATPGSVACVFLFVVLASNGVAVDAIRGGTIAKVVSMLQGMLDKSKEDGEKEAEIYEKFKTYCDENEEEKSQSVADLTTEIRLISSKIGELQGSTGGLSTECGKLKADIEANEAARAEAENVRKKAHENFVAEESDMIQAVGQLQEAIKVLADIGADQGKAESAEHAQMMAGLKVKNGNVVNPPGSEADTSLLKVKDTVKQSLAAAAIFLTPKQRSTMQSFLQAPFTATYTAQSAQILGILKSMLETFQSNLESARETEKSEVEAFGKFMKTKKELYDTMKASYDKKQENMGSNDGDLATKKTQLGDAEEKKADDEAFLAKLKVMCPDKSKEYRERKQLRDNEEKAIATAIAILDREADFGLGAGSAPAGLLQLRSRGGRSLRRTSSRQQAAVLLRSVASSEKSLRLAKIAHMLESGNPFDIVLIEIEKMIELLGQEGKMDQEQRDWCDSERESNHADLEEKKAQIDTLNTEIEDIDKAINDPQTGLKFQIKDSEESIKTNHDSQQTETSARADENKAYQSNIAEIIDTEETLAKAVKLLKKFYASLKKRSAEESAEGKAAEAMSRSASLIQREEPAPPSTWDKEFKGQNGKGDEVIKLIETIEEDTKKEEGAAHDAEEEGQNAYEDSMADLTKQEADLKDSLVNLQKELKDKQKEDKTKRAELTETEEDKHAIERYLEKVKPGCDFITENFDLRKTNRKAETDALKEATKLLKDSPGFKSASVSAEQEAMGDCKKKCVGSEDQAECKACLAGISVPGYCAGHAGAPGC